MLYGRHLRLEGRRREALDASRRSTSHRLGRPGSGSGGAALALSSSGIAKSPSISPGVEARETEIEVGGMEFLHFQREQIFIPVCPGD